MTPDLADDRAVAVGFERQRGLCRRTPTPRLRDRNNEFRRPAAFDRRQPERLTVFVEGMVETRLCVGRIEDRPLVKGIRNPRSLGVERAEPERQPPPVPVECKS
jgi:hypothetical protein